MSFEAVALQAVALEAMSFEAVALQAVTLEAMSASCVLHEFSLLDVSPMANFLRRQVSTYSRRTLCSRYIRSHVKRAAGN
jgi:hypothetical protein